MPATPATRVRSGGVVTAFALLVLAGLLPSTASAATPTPVPSASAVTPSPAAAAATPSASGSASPSPNADAVAKAKQLRETAQQQVAAFRAQVDQANAVLSDGAKRLEAEQAQLARIRADQTGAQQHAQDAVARSDAARARVALVVGQAFRSSVPDAVTLALTTGPDGIRDAVVARADLDRVRGSSTDALRGAKAARVTADAAVRTASQLTAAAAQQEAAVAADVDRLKTYAMQSQTTLEAASTALAAAQQAEQLAVADAAARAAAEQSALAAQAAALAAAKANRGVLATCTAQPTGTLINGFLDPAILCPLDDAPGKALQPTAAAAFNAMNAAYKASTGTPLCITDSYRSYFEQIVVFASRPGLAAVPGRSNHGLGLALDMCGGVENFGSDAHIWMKVNAVRFGWFHPDWAEPTGSLPEAWHWEYADGDYSSGSPGS